MEYLRLPLGNVADGVACIALPVSLRPSGHRDDAAKLFVDSRFVPGHFVVALRKQISP